MSSPVQTAARERLAGVTGRLPADLAKLRDRFLSEHPHEAGRAEWLAHVPAAFRHVLSLRLELDRADTLPRRYAELAGAALDGAAKPGADADAVDRLVIAHAHCIRGGRLADAARMMPELRKFFTEPQIVELVFTLMLGRALAGFDEVMGGKPGVLPLSSHRNPTGVSEPQTP